MLGANDGIVSTAAIIVGVASADSTRAAILTAGTAGLVAGAASMAAGEYVSVSSQADAERADLAVEQRELRSDPEGEQQELAAIYLKRGLSSRLAEEVAAELSAREDLLQVHARDELGMTELSHARPLQAAGASAASFTVGAALPLIAVILAPASARIAGDDGSDDGRAGGHRMGGRPHGGRPSRARNHPGRRLGNRGDAADDGRRPRRRHRRVGRPAGGRSPGGCQMLSSISRAFSANRPSGETVAQQRPQVALERVAALAEQVRRG